ncbi:cytochrome P450 monooxygenase-like protein [Lophiotrema nucula]|uniref:Cytochrome P450 monooxygenase-like protein n=1 Tax=Lophiotrema nucula TaxID=690887 RepID=A0A6A5Z9P8_9PLEO|nr:cytochrome P450 monooxygenase-like protein [Lophiotrema nucula]
MMLSVASLPIIVFALPALLAAHILYSYFTNPLRRVPAAHPLSHFTNFWIHWVRWQAIENATLKEAHARLGPIVCLGPDEISVNCVKGGLRDVYTGGFEKSNGNYNWYDYFTNYNGTPNMFSTGGNKAHSSRKRTLSNIYSKSVVTASPALLAQTSRIMYDRFLPYLARTFDQAAPGALNIYALLSASTMDIVTGYIFGLKASSNLLDDPTELTRFLDLYNSRRSFNYWGQEFPGLTETLNKWFGYRFVPKFVEDANEDIEKWTLEMCDNAANVLQQSDMNPEETPVVYQQLSLALAKEAKKSGDNKPNLRFPVASELLDHLAAGFDTSGITLTYVVHELSKHPDIQSKLRQELLDLSRLIIPSSAPILPDPKEVDSLPYLNAVILESLRLHSAIPGPQPRFTPPQGCRLGPEEQDYFIPGGIRVSASAGLLHLNEQVYPSPEEWRPERWLEEVDEDRKKDMESRWFWAFGSGGRMCVGSHLAIYQMKYIVAALYSNYTTHIVDDTGIQQIDAYTAPPTSDKLMIRLEKHVNNTG